MRSTDRGGLGLKTGPGNFQMTFHPTGPARAKSLKNSEITFLPRKNDRFLLTPYRPTGHCPNASMASPPLLPPDGGEFRSMTLCVPVPSDVGPTLRDHVHQIVALNATNVPCRRPSGFALSPNDSWNFIYCLLFINNITRNDCVRQRFSTVIVLRPLDDLSKVSATPNNKIVWVTSKKSIFRGYSPSRHFR